MYLFGAGPVQPGQVSLVVISVRQKFADCARITLSLILTRANTGDASLLVDPSNDWGVTGRANPNLLDVRLDRAAAQDDALERRRLGPADPLGQPSAQQMGLPGRGRLPRAAGPPKRNDQRLILLIAAVVAILGLVTALLALIGVPAGIT